MNILLTGATGFLGKQLTIRLLSEGHNVYALIRNERKADRLLDSLSTELQNNLSIIKGNVANDRLGVSVETINLLKDKIDTVYHIAAYLSFDDRDREKTFDINVNGTKNVLEFSKEIRTKKFYHVSTAYTLGDQLFGREELHPKDNTFVNPYEESKCHAEHLVFEYSEDFHVSIFRPSIIIGDSKTGEAETTFALYGVIRSLELLKKRLERKQVKGEKIKFLCTEEAAQNLVPVDYVVTVLTLAIDHAKRSTIYHITNPTPPTNQLVLDLIQSSLDFYQVELVPTDYDGELTDQDIKLNQPMKVFHKYFEKTLTFDDSNTRKLLQDANIDPFTLDREMLERIISGGRTNPINEKALK